MGSLFRLIKRISFLVIVLVGMEHVLAQLNDRISERNTIPQGSTYFFYKPPEYPKDCKEAFNQCSSSNSSGIRLIRPTGYTDPFEVYCSNEHMSDGWTIIQRRLDGSISFNRNWTEFKNGFGFLSSEFWLGNVKLSYLTNQATYQLGVDMQLYSGLSFSVIYNSFRISDEWSHYALVSIGSFQGNMENAVTHCPLNMIYETRTCQPTCSNPKDTTTCNRTRIEQETCVCEDGFLKKGDDCVPPIECECFLTDINEVLSNDESYVSIDCSVKYNCQDDRLHSDPSYRCSPNAECGEKNGVRQCYCNEGYEGNGSICRPLYTDCYDAYQAGHREDGVYTILPSGWPGSPFNVSCVMSTNGGGWTVIQRRSDGVTDFNLNWDSYRYGFGSFDRDFWLGNEQLHYLTNQKNYILRIDIVTSGGTSKYDEYSSFRINNNNHKFRLENIGSHSGTAGNSMWHTSGRSFSTYDQDNDECGNHNCAQRHRGAWWYLNDWCIACWSSKCDHFQYSSSCNLQCSESNLNGDYNGRNGENVFVYDCNLNFAEMKLRPS